MYRLVIILLTLLIDLGSQLATSQ